MLEPYDIDIIAARFATLATLIDDAAPIRNFPIAVRIAFEEFALDLGRPLALRPARRAPQRAPTRSGRMSRPSRWT